MHTFAKGGDDVPEKLRVQKVPPGPKPTAKYLVVSASCYGMPRNINDHGKMLNIDVSEQRQAIFESRALVLVKRITPAWFVFEIRRG